MKKLTAIIIANNEIEYAKLTVEGFRNFADPEDVEVVLVDNHSQDGLREWASGQNDLTYVYMDEGEEKAGFLLSDVTRALDINTDILFMEAHYLLTPFALDRMYGSLYSDDTIGMIGGIINGEYQSQKPSVDVSNYGEASQYSIGADSVTVKNVLAISSGPVIIKADTLKKIGGFEINLGSLNKMLIQMAFKGLKNGFRSVVRSEAVIWNLLPGEPVISAYSAKYLDEDAAFMEKCWGTHYFNTLYNASIITLIDCEPDRDLNVLEIGCDCGATLLEIKNRFPNANVFGLEISEPAVEIASVFADTRAGNIEDEDLPFDEKFDYIIFGDVLEHLHNPLRTIEYVTSVLKPEGRILACIPNVMHISVIEELLKGNFTYSENGLLDKTHIHMFTYNEILRMFTDANYTIREIFGVPGSISEMQKGLINRLLELEPAAERFMYVTFQYVLSAEYVGPNR